MEEKHQQKVYYLLDKYGIVTLITARYIAFVRTAYPYIVGATELPQGRFHRQSGQLHHVDLPAGRLWLLPEPHPLASEYQSQFLSIILCLPIVLLVGGLIALIWRWLSKRKANAPRIETNTQGHRKMALFLAK